jgi:hypothetical protein
VQAPTVRVGKILTDLTLWLCNTLQTIRFSLTEVERMAFPISVRTAFPYALMILFPFQLILASCDSNDPFSPDDPPRITFRKVLEREVSDVTGYPSGLAVTPDGQWLVSLGFSTATITVYNPSTLQPVAGPVHEIPCPPPHDCDGFDPIIVVNPHAVAVSPDGSLAVVTNRTGVLGLRLPSLDLQFRQLHSLRGFPRHVVRDRTGENYYIGGEDYDVARLTASGDVGSLFEAEGVEGIALTRDEEDLLVLTEFGARLVVLNTPDLTPRLAIDLPFEGEVVVPLKAHDRAVVVGGAPRNADTAARTPVMAMSVDLATGSTGSLQILSEPLGGQTVLFGDGNQWADVGQSTSIVPTSHGTAVIDTDHGTVDFYLQLESDPSPCCDIGRYPTGNRVVMANAKSLPGTGFPGGSLIVYEIDD